MVGTRPPHRLLERASARLLDPIEGEREALLKQAPSGLRDGSRYHQMNLVADRHASQSWQQPELALHYA